MIAIDCISLKMVLLKQLGCRN